MKDYVSTDFTGLPHTAWAGASFTLSSWTTIVLASHLFLVSCFLGNPEVAEALRRIRTKYKHLFYDRDLNSTKAFISHLRPMNW